MIIGKPVNGHLGGGGAQTRPIVSSAVTGGTVLTGNIVSM